MPRNDRRRLTHDLADAQARLQDTATDLVQAQLDAERLRGQLACLRTELLETQLKLAASLEAARRMMTMSAN